MEWALAFAGQGMYCGQTVLDRSGVGISGFPPYLISGLNSVITRHQSLCGRQPPSLGSSFPQLCDLRFLSVPPWTSAFAMWSRPFCLSIRKTVMTRGENEVFQLLLFLLLWSKLGRQLQGRRIYLGSCFQAAVPWACNWADHHGGNMCQRTSLHSMHDQKAQRREAARNNMSPTICFSGLLPTTSHLQECLQSPQEAPVAGK